MQLTPEAEFIFQKLRPYQQDAVEAVLSSEHRHAVFALHRGAGKSLTACAIALIWAYRNPRQSIIYAAPEKQSVRTIAIPHIEFLLEGADFPAPNWIHIDSAYEFENGSRIYMAAVDRARANATRGKDAHLCILDEEAFSTDSDYFLKSVILPRTILVDGKILHISTPAPSPSHPFCRAMVEAEKGGYLHKLTTEDNEFVPQKAKDELREELGGADSATYRRECLCQILVDEKYALFPDFQNQPETTGKLWGAVSVIPNKGITALKAHVSTHISVVTEYAFPEGSMRDLIFLKDEFKGLPVLFEGEKKSAEYLSRNGFPVRHTPDTFLDAGIPALRAVTAREKLSISASCPLTERHVREAVWFDLDERNKLGDSGDGMRFDMLRPLSILASTLHLADTQHKRPCTSWEDMFNPRSRRSDFAWKR